MDDRVVTCNAEVLANALKKIADLEYEVKELNETIYKQHQIIKKLEYEVNKGRPGSYEPA